MNVERYELIITPTACRQLTETLPESVAFAAHEFIVGPLLENPQRVGKRGERQRRHTSLRGPMAGTPAVSGRNAPRVEDEAATCSTNLSESPVAPSATEPSQRGEP